METRRKVNKAVKVDKIIHIPIKFSVTEFIHSATRRRSISYFNVRSVSAIN
jgi:hypothetical protein